jgi:hypothetical protein
MSVTLCDPVTDANVADGVFGSREVTIRENRRSHKKGPKVEPCPGPNRGTSVVLL